MSRSLPRLQRPLSAADMTVVRPRPQVGRPPSLPGMSHAPVPQGDGQAEVDVLACARCGHHEELHPVRYVCDKYPHPDPLQICGCEAGEREEVCSTCGHKARSHKPRHRCRACSCWSFERAEA